MATSTAASRPMLAPADAGCGNKESGENAMIVIAEPGCHLLQIKYEERRINRHIKDAGGQRKPRFLESPEIAQAPAHPRVVTTFSGQSARKLADHERRRQAPENRKEKQDENATSVARARDDGFCSIGAPGHHEERRSNKRPERQFCGCLSC